MDVLNKSKSNFLITVILIIISSTIGIAGYTFYYAKGWSYLSDNPNSCTNCHVMNEQYSSWSNSAHAKSAVCNDCHLPHNKIGKYLVKAENGFLHSWAFTLNKFQDVIRIKPRSLKRVQNACISCHDPMVEAVNIQAHKKGFELNCMSCHKGIGHRK